MSHVKNRSRDVLYKTANVGDKACPAQSYFMGSHATRKEPPNSLQRILICDLGTGTFLRKGTCPQFQNDGCSVATDLPLGETGNSLKASCFEKQGLLPLLL